MPDINYLLIEDRTLYRKVITPTGDSSWVRGVKYPSSNPTITYESFLGEYEPLSRGESRKVLPQGLNTSEAIIVFSDIKLNISTNNNGNNNEGDTIYLEDPNVNPSAEEFVVYDREDWAFGPKYELLTNNSYDYICIRKELV